MGTRLGAALLALSMAWVVAVPAAANEGTDQAGGALGAIYPGLEVEGWVAPAGSSSRVLDPVPIKASVEEVRALLGDGEFTWADRPYAMGDVRSANAVGAASWHRSGRLGEGVTVAVVDVGFSGYRSLLGSGLPASVTTVSFRADGTMDGGTSHGTAAAEIVHAIAPRADIHLVAFDGDLFRVVQYLIDTGVDIVSFSVGYLSGPFDGTSPASRAVAWAADAGIVWVSAAGNYAEDHWGGAPLDGDGDGWVDLSDTDEIDEFVVAAGAEFHLYLSWVGGGDLDLCIYEIPAEVGRPTACAAGVQGDGGRGLEVARWRNDSSHSARFGFSIRRQSGSPTHADVVGWNIADLERAVAAGSVVAPADAEMAVTVGAVLWSQPTRVMSYSGRGPTAAGTSKPDLVAPTGIATSSWGAFGGTSGATPHVAGIAALLLEAYPATTAEAMGGLLRDRASPSPTGAGAGAGLASVGARTPACAGRAPSLVGTNRDDRLVGSRGDDIIHARAGDDTVYGGGGDDLICGGSGLDKLYGQRGADVLFGQAGRDRLFGGSGRDRLLAGAGNDVIRGGGGEDTLRGGSGHDHCSAGSASGCE